MRRDVLPLLPGRAIAYADSPVRNSVAPPRHPGSAQRSPGSRNTSGAGLYTVSGSGWHASGAALRVRARLWRPGMTVWCHMRSPCLEGEGWGEVWSISGKLTHLTLSLSFQERGPASEF